MQRKRSRPLRRARHPFFGSDASVWCLLMAFVLEVLEDFIIHREVLPYSPPPPVAKYADKDNMDPFQLYTHDQAEEAESTSPSLE